MFCLIIRFTRSTRMTGGTALILYLLLPLPFPDLRNIYRVKLMRISFAKSKFGRFPNLSRPVSASPFVTFTFSRARRPSLRRGTHASIRRTGRGADGHAV